jgi:hypothetical protein
VPFLLNFTLIYEGAGPSISLSIRQNRFKSSKKEIKTVQNCLIQQSTSQGRLEAYKFFTSHGSAAIYLRVLRTLFGDATTTLDYASPHRTNHLELLCLLSPNFVVRLDHLQKNQAGLLLHTLLATAMKDVSTAMTDVSVDPDIDVSMAAIDQPNLEAGISIADDSGLCFYLAPPVLLKCPSPSPNARNSSEKKKSSEAEIEQQDCFIRAKDENGLEENKKMERKQEQDLPRDSD